MCGFKAEDAWAGIFRIITDFREHVPESLLAGSIRRLSGRIQCASIPVRIFPIPPQA